jgi:hypothetical protein
MYRGHWGPKLGPKHPRFAVVPPCYARRLSAEAIKHQIRFAMPKTRAKLRRPTTIIWDALLDVPDSSHDKYAHSH